MSSMTMRSQQLQLLSVLFFALLVRSCRAQAFSQRFFVPWGNWNAFSDDTTQEVRLQLMSDAGANIQSYNSFLYGHFSARVKLVPGNSAGVVASYYLTSFGDYHDEIDFEFLGNVSGQPCALHTNLFVHGIGNREQRIYLWFDPTADFHTYSVYWNHQQILWTVDDIPIRVHKNREAQNPNTFPYYQPMVVAGSIFDASSWATRNGLDKIDWSYAPFVVTFSNFVSDGCQVYNNDVAPCNVNWESNYWEVAPYSSLDANQVGQLNWVKSNYLIYDYCTDVTRYPTPPQECYDNSVFP